MKIYVINLKHREDRRNSIKKQFENLGLDESQYEFLEAYSKDNIVINDKSIYNKSGALKLNKALSLSEIATALSHKLAQQKILSNNLDGALILEDDAIITDDLLKVINGEIKLDNTLDIILFGYYSSYTNCKYEEISNVAYLNTGRIKDPISKVFFDSELTLQKRFYKFKYPSRELDFIHGFHGYYMTKFGANKFIEFNTPIICEADNIFNYMYERKIELNYACAYPTIINVDNSNSDNESLREDGYGMIFNRRLNHKDFGKM